MRPQPTKRPGSSAPLALSPFVDERVRRAVHARAEPPTSSPHACQKLRPEGREQTACSATAARWAPPSARDPPHDCTHPFGSAALPASLTRGRWTSGPGRSPWVWTIASSRPKLSSTWCRGHGAPGSCGCLGDGRGRRNDRSSAVVQPGGERHPAAAEEISWKQRCARNGAGVCARAWQGARRWVAGWASGVSVAGQVYGRRGWALPYVQSDVCCLRGSSRPAALSADPTCCLWT